MSTFDFGSLLTTEQKRSLIEQRISQFASEAYQHTLNKQTAKELNSEDTLDTTNDALQILEAAIRVHQAELAKLPPVTE